VYHVTDFRSYDALWSRWHSPQRVVDERGVRVSVEQPLVANRYRLEAKVGMGQFGTVYRATDLQLRREVAIKIVAPQSSWEAIAMARLTHPSIATLHDYGTADGCGYLVMEFLRGSTLAVWRTSSPRSRRDIIETYLSAGWGIAAAHSKGVVHCDIKPENVMVCDDGRVVVLDFGIAALLQNSPKRDGIGTLAYMAPEQITGAAVSAATDQFAFCVALWEALMESSPFTGRTSSARLDSQISGPREPIPPGALGRILRRGLALNPGDRWPSIQALLTEISRTERRRDRRPALLACAVGVAALATFGLLPATPSTTGADASVLTAEDLTVRSLTVLATSAASDGRAEDALRLLEVAELRARGKAEARLVADSADAIGLELYVHGEYMAAVAAHDRAFELYTRLSEDALALRARELGRAAQDARGN
jgi:predicted Ser/Thr protein kinase